MTAVGVAITAGPHRIYAELLVRTLRSLRAQTRVPDHIIIVDDMTGLAERAPEIPGLLELLADDEVFVHRTAWQLGALASLNVALAFSDADVTLMLAPGDVAAPTAIDALEATLRETATAAEAAWWEVPTVSALRVDGVAAECAPATAIRPELWRFNGGFEPGIGMRDPTWALRLKMLALNPRIFGRVHGDGLIMRVHGQPWQRLESAAEWGRYGL